MQKVVKFIESYVQWLALGLALLWVVWVGYAYWVQKPVFKEINHQAYGPAEVDEFVAKPGGPIDSLSRSLKSEGKIPDEVVKYFPPVPEYVNVMKNEMSGKEFLAADIQPFSTGGVGSFVPEAPKVTIGDKSAESVKILPDTAKMLGSASGISVVYAPNPKAVVDPKNTQQKLLQPPVDPNAPPPAPVADPNNPNPAPVAPTPIVLEPKDVSWITVSANFDMKKLATAFTTANIPAPAAFTQFLRVRLVREELMPDGTWGDNKVIKDLPIEFKPPFPAPAGTEGIYLDWSSKNVADIVEPPFYEVLRGSLWRTFLMPDLSVAAPPVLAEFDPANVKPADVSKLDPDQKKKYYEYVQKQAAEKQKADQEQRKNSRPRPTGPTPGRGAPPAGSPPPMANEQIAQNTPPPAYERRRGAAYPPTGRASETMTPQPQYTSSGTPAAPSAAMPTGVFTPATAQDLEIWAHDDTTVPGHVYHYKIEVYVKNPLFGNGALAKNPADAAKLDLLAPTDWSDKIESPRKQYFFASTAGDAIAGNNPKMKFEYFWWEDGDWKTKTIILQPGDAIGATPWTLVDIRPYGNLNENRAILVNESGEIDSRFFKTDMGSADYKMIKSKVRPAAAATAQ